MTNENKLASMGAVGELPDFGNLLLRESGYPHLPASQSDAWNEAGTKPDHPCLCLTDHGDKSGTWFQYFDGEFFCCIGETELEAIDFKGSVSSTQNPKWREVQP